MSRRAMVLAAGLGLRMRPITLTIPKPLVEVDGRTMLDRMLDHMAAAGVTRCVVNTHHLGRQIHTHLAGRPNILFSDETDEVLETGGGVAKALPLLGDEAFFVANSDIVYTNDRLPALARLAEAWDETRMDALLLLSPVATAFGYEGRGDFFLEREGGPPRRRGEAAAAPYLFTGVQMLHPRLFAGAPAGKFSLNVLYDRALEAGRLFALIHDGEWFHIGTPESLAAVRGKVAAAERLCR